MVPFNLLEIIQGVFLHSFFINNSFELVHEMKDDGIDLVIVVFERLKVQWERHLMINCHVFLTKKLFLHLLCSHS